MKGRVLAFQCTIFTVVVWAAACTVVVPASPPPQGPSASVETSPPPPSPSASPSVAPPPPAGAENGALGPLPPAGAKCVGWRQTNSCLATGHREPHNDRACTEPLE